MIKRINNRKGKLGRSPKHNKHIHRSIIRFQNRNPGLIERMLIKKQFGLGF